jgi:hypothetical protein
MRWQGYRAPRAAGGGLYNGYRTPKARQCWEVGQVVSCGFLKGLVVKARVARAGEPDAYALWQAATNRWYQFQPHCGLSRCDDEREAMT